MGRFGASGFKQTGKSCGGNDLSTTVPVDSGETKLGDPPVPCGANMCPGSVNGAHVCVPCKASEAPGPSTAASGATPGNDPGNSIKGSETKTECNGTHCTTTTIYRDAAGNIVGEAKKTEEQASFCEENPALQICKDSMFGGACASGFTCEGDLARHYGCHLSSIKRVILRVERPESPAVALRMPNRVAGLLVDRSKN